MLSALHHEIEVADDSASLYLHGMLSSEDAVALGGACAQLPARVTTLRLDLRDAPPHVVEAAPALTAMYL